MYQYDENQIPDFEKETKETKKVLAKKPMLRYQYSDLITTYIQATLLSGIVLVVLFVILKPIYTAIRLYTVNQWDMSERTFYVLSMFLWHAGLYFGVNGMFLSFEYFKLFEDKKFPRKKHAKFPPTYLIKQCIIDGVKDQLMSIVTLVFIYPITKYFGVEYEPKNWPSVYNVFLTGCVSFVWLDTSFYWTHRFLHRGWWYEKVHKKHHQFKATIGFAAEHAHWFEQLFSNQIPSITVVLLTGSHHCVTLAWLFFRLWETYEGHSGYEFLHAGEGFHDFHHTHGKSNLGAHPLWDTIMGTCDPWFRERYQRSTQSKKTQ